jgi:hypothetical protein
MGMETYITILEKNMIVSITFHIFTLNLISRNVPEDKNPALGEKY